MPPLEVVIAVHIGAGLTAVIAGGWAMLTPKRPGRHPRRGRTYLVALSVVAVTATVLAIARPHTAHLLILGALALICAGVGLAARRIRWPGWLTYHITGIASSYILMLTAFYVDNGPRLPLWQLLPPITFWFLPAAVGVPLLARALLRYRSHPSATRTTDTPP